MIIAVTGFRDYKDRAFIHNVMDRVHQAHITALVRIHVRMGDAPGADDMVLQWCRERGVSHHVFVADRFPSGALKPHAGPWRNRRMLTGTGDPVTGIAQLLLAFPNPAQGSARIPGSGTWGCMGSAVEMGIEVLVPPYRRSST